MTTLRCDWDHALTAAQWQRALFQLRLWQLTVQGIGLSRSQRGGWHAEIVVSETVPPVYCVAMQAALGSDGVREAINLCRVRARGQVSRYWRDRWNVLYAQYWVHFSSRRRRQRRTQC